MGEGSPGSDVDMTLASSAFVHMRDSIETLMAEGYTRKGFDGRCAGTVDRRARCGGPVDRQAVPAVG